MRTIGTLKDEIMLSTGRTEYANCGILGLAVNEDDSDFVYYGRDGGFSTKNWTQDERNELADEMILRWKKFKEWRE